MTDTVTSQELVVDVVEVETPTVVTEVASDTTIITQADVTEIVETPVTETILEEVEAIEIVEIGVQGPAGPNGPAGPTGPAGTGASQLELEMGETLTKGTPLYVAADKFYAADHVTNFRVIGLLAENKAVGLLGSAMLTGPLALSGLSTGSPYFLGNGIISTTAPSSGFVVRVGQAITSGVLSVNIEEPVLLN